MGEARNVLDKVTEGARTHDADAMARNYAPDAVLTTPDGTFKGRDEIREYFGSFIVAFPDLDPGVGVKLETGDTAADEGVATGTNTGPLPAPDGSTIPATGKRMSLRVADIVTVEHGLVKTHRMYWDNAEFAAQLGLS